MTESRVNYGVCRVQDLENKSYTGSWQGPHDADNQAVEYSCSTPDLRLQVNLLRKPRSQLLISPACSAISSMLACDVHSLHPGKFWNHLPSPQDLKEHKDHSKESVKSLF